jgi:hypothetical protein
MNRNHHTSEWFLNNPNGWVILFGDIITGSRLPVFYVHSRQMNENMLSVKLKTPRFWNQCQNMLMEWNSTCTAQYHR